MFLLQTDGTIIYEAQNERQKPRKYVFGERKYFDFEKPIDKYYSYGQQVDEPSDSVTDHESQNIMMIKNMIEKQMSDINQVDATTNQVTHASTTISTVDIIQTPSVETVAVDTIEISSSSDPPGVETEGWSMIGVIFLVAISTIILALLISLFTFVVKNYLFYCFSRDEGTKQKIKFEIAIKGSKNFNKIFAAIVTSYSSCSSLDCEMV